MTYDVGPRPGSHRRPVGCTHRRRLAAFVACLSALVALTGPAGASDFHSWREDVGVLGMGGAYTAGSWRGSGLMYNPASLARKRFHMNVPIRVEVGGAPGVAQVTDIVRYFRDNRDELEAVAGLTQAKLEDMNQRAIELDNTSGTVRVLPAIRVGWNHFSVEAYGLLEAAPLMNSGVFQPRFDVYQIGDIGVVAGYGRTIETERKWYAGVAVRYFNRWERYRTFSIDEASEGPALSEVVTFKNRKAGLSADVGAQMPIWKTFAVGAVAQNLLKFGAIQPPTLVNVGVHYLMVSRMHLVADYRDLLNRQNLPAPMHVHLGAEFDLTLLRLRAGAYQGYPTFGFGINLWLIKIDAVYYTRELGQRLGHRPENALTIEIQVGIE